MCVNGMLGRSATGGVYEAESCCTVGQTGNRERLRSGELIIGLENKEPKAIEETTIRKAECRFETVGHTNCTKPTPRHCRAKSTPTKSGLGSKLKLIINRFSVANVK